MKEATPQELRERYRDLSDGELLLVAADSSGLTPGAASALRSELSRRKLSNAEISETRENLKRWREEEARYQPAPVDLRTQIRGALISLIQFFAILVLWLVVHITVRKFTHSNETVERFDNAVFSVFALLYVLWRAVTALRKMRRKKR